MTNLSIKVGVEWSVGIGRNIAGGATYGATSETIHISDAFKKKD